MKFLKKGIVVPDYKYRSLSSTQIHLPFPARNVWIRLDQSAGSFAAPCVAAGDQVLTGTKIADTNEWAGVPVHSSVSGFVREVTDRYIMIQSDESDRLDSSVHIRSQIPSDAVDLCNQIRAAGIVGPGAETLPTHVRLRKAREHGVRTLVLNGCESEPFLTADHLLMLNHPVEILKGAELIRIASGAERVIIAVEKNKLEAIELLNSKNYNLKLKHIEMMAFPVRYPQGSERVLIESVTGKKPIRGCDPLSSGVLVEHVATAFAVYEAVYLGKPLYERVVTIGGPCVVEPKNVWARIGTRVGDLVRSTKGFMREPERVLFGGPMTGETIRDLDVPMMKRVQGIIALPKELAPAGEEEACIRCGWCVDVCPESLIPETIVRAVQNEDWQLAQEYDVDSCTECGCCTYVCPSNIQMGKLLRSGRSHFTVPQEEAKPEPAYVFSSQG